MRNITLFLKVENQQPALFFQNGLKIPLKAFLRFKPETTFRG